MGGFSRNVYTEKTQKTNTRAGTCRKTGTFPVILGRIGAQLVTKVVFFQNFLTLLFLRSVVSTNCEAIVQDLHQISRPFQGNFCSQPDTAPF